MQLPRMHRAIQAACKSTGTGRGFSSDEDTSGRPMDRIMYHYTYDEFPHGGETRYPYPHRFYLYGSRQCTGMAKQSNIPDLFDILSRADKERIKLFLRKYASRSLTLEVRLRAHLIRS